MPLSMVIGEEKNDSCGVRMGAAAGQHPGERVCAVDVHRVDVSHADHCHPVVRLQPR